MQPTVRQPEDSDEPNDGDDRRPVAVATRITLHPADNQIEHRTRLLVDGSERVIVKGKLPVLGWRRALLEALRTRFVIDALPDPEVEPT